MSTVAQWTSLALCLSMLACRPTAPPAPVTQPQRTTTFDTQPYAEGRLAAGSNVFLVAGGDDIANFAQEIVTQRHLWAAAGVQDETIACYWAKPNADAWQADREQYDALQHQLTGCRRAEAATLRTDLLTAARSEPPWVYLYVTSHGSPPLLAWHGRNKDPREIAEQFEVSNAELDAINQPVIGLQAGPGPRLSQPRRIIKEHRAGSNLGDLMLSPKTLAETLHAFPDDTLKIVVLQACFSGGFIGDTGEDGALSPLTEVPNIVILTATAHDRPSFGCGAGSLSTYYGGALNKALARRLIDDATPDTLAWETIWEDTAFVVDAMESIDGESPSLPTFFSNRGGSQVVR